MDVMSAFVDFSPSLNLAQSKSVFFTKAYFLRIFCLFSSLACPQIFSGSDFRATCNRKMPIKHYLVLKVLPEVRKDQQKPRQFVREKDAVEPDEPSKALGFKSLLRNEYS